MDRKLIEKLDKFFSIYIRTKDANEFGIVKCYTCGQYHHWKQVDAGHYISRRHYGTRWQEKNVKPQCKGCNIFNQGNASNFISHLIRDYGVEIIDILDHKKNAITKMSNFELSFLIEEYKKKSNKSLLAVS